MSSAQGRFTSTDPKQFSARTLANPQKWNKYAYVHNNPLSSVDPDGLDDYKVFMIDQHGWGWELGQGPSGRSGQRPYNAGGQRCPGNNWRLQQCPGGP
jgi:hypothetical protein